MNYQALLQTAEELFAHTGDRYIIDDLKNRIAAGSTGGEIAVLVGCYVYELKTKNGNAYALLQPAIAEFLTQCRKSGLLIGEGLR